MRGCIEIQVGEKKGHNPGMGMVAGLPRKKVLKKGKQLPKRNRK